MIITTKRPLILSLSVHIVLLLILLLGAYLEKPHLVAAHAARAENKPLDRAVIKAAVVDNQAVANAIARQELVEKKKQQQLAKETKQAEKLKQEVKRSKELAEKLKAEAEAARLSAKQELAKASKLQEQVAQAKQQVEHEKKQAAQVKQQVAEAKQQVDLAKQEIEQTKQAQQVKEQVNNNAQLAEQQSKEQVAAAQLRAEKRRRWIDSELSRFVAGVEERIYSNRTLSSAFQEGLICKIQIQLMPDGAVSMVRVVDSSGNAAYDSMAEAAVYKSSPFDMPADKEVVSDVVSRGIIFNFTDDYMS